MALITSTHSQALGDSLSGGDGNDFLQGSFAIEYLSGLGGDDTLIGSGNKDTILGGDGADLIIGGQFAEPHLELLLSEDMQDDAVHIERPHPSHSAELLIGEAGNDTLVGGNWQDNIENGQVDQEELGLGTPILEGQPGFHNIIWAGTGDDVAYGANGFDTIGGGAGDDELYGFGGVDVIYGGAGSDNIFGGDGDPQLFHRLDADQSFTLYETLYGGAGNDWVWGQGGQDRLYGGTGDDKLYGGEDSDTLYGGEGRDELSGGEGDDTLTGGEGPDTFWFDFDDSADVITDFDLVEDRLVLYDTNHQVFVDAVENASETTVQDQSGLMIDTGNGSLFLVGLTEADVPSIEVNVLFGD